MSGDTWREIGEYLAEQPLGDEMTDAELAVLLFVATFDVQHGRVPTHREIADARGLTVAAARQTVRTLHARGQLQRHYRRGPAGTLVLVDGGDQS